MPTRSTGWRSAVGEVLYSGPELDPEAFAKMSERNAGVGGDVLLGLKVFAAYIALPGLWIWWLLEVRSPIGLYRWSAHNATQSEEATGSRPWWCPRVDEAKARRCRVLRSGESEVDGAGPRCSADGGWCGGKRGI